MWVGGWCGCGEEQVQAHRTGRPIVLVPVERDLDFGEGGRGGEDTHTLALLISNKGRYSA